jgi:hypothetical protein
MFCVIFIILSRQMLEEILKHYPFLRRRRLA